MSDISVVLKVNADEFNKSMRKFGEAVVKFGTTIRRAKRHQLEKRGISFGGIPTLGPGTDV